MLISLPGEGHEDFEPVNPTMQFLTDLTRRVAIPLLTLVDKHNTQFAQRSLTYSKVQFHSNQPLPWLCAVELLPSMDRQGMLPL